MMIISGKEICTGQQTLEVHGTRCSHVAFLPGPSCKRLRRQLYIELNYSSNVGSYPPADSATGSGIGPSMEWLTATEPT